MKVKISIKDKKLAKDPDIKKYLKFIEHTINKCLKDHEENMILYGCHIIKLELEEDK